MTECPFCLSADREDLEDQIGQGSLQRRQAAMILQTDLETVNRHMRDHLGVVHVQPVKEPVPKELGELFSKRDILMNRIEALAQRVDAFEKGGVDFEKSTTDQIVSMTEAIRKLVVDLAKIQGELKEEQHITFQYFTNLKTFVFNSLCSECRANLERELCQ